ncbi:MAG: protein translocase subunit SecF [Spirochaetales bacterium]
MLTKKAIPFSRLRYWMYGASIAMIILSWAGTFLEGGFNLGIDFKPGLSESVQITASNVTIERVREALKGSEHSFTVQPIGVASENRFQLRAVAKQTEAKEANLQEKLSSNATVALEKTFGAGSVKVEQTEFIGPSLSSELVVQTTWIALAAILVILLYIWFRFKFAYALAAIIALVHDPIVVLGLIGTVQMEVTTATIAVILTIIGYSLNDTIVVFDRIRENIRITPTMNMYDLIDMAITQTLSRTIVSSLTVLLSMVAVYVFTQGAIHDFALALIVGVVIGTYSSIFIAAPLMVAIAGGKPPKEKEKKILTEGETAEA